MSRSGRFLISGCSSGGKSTLRDALSNCGYATVAEPGRRVIAAEHAQNSDALPWVDPVAFAQKCLALAKEDLRTAQDTQNHVFFDRGVIDAAVDLLHTSGVPFETSLGTEYSYDDPIFLAPPWPEIYVQEPDRRHPIATAIAEYDRITVALQSLSYRIEILPRASVTVRVGFIVETLKSLQKR